MKSKQTIASPQPPQPAKLPQGIRHTKAGTYLLDMRVNGTRITKTFENLEEAILYKASLKQAPTSPNATSTPTPNTPTHTSATPTSRPIWTLRQAYDCAHRVHWYNMASKRTNEFNGQAALKFFGSDCPLTEITLPRIDAYIEQRFNRGAKGGTINRKISCLSVMLKTAFDRDGYGSPENTLPRFPKRVKEMAGRTRFLSPEEEKKLLSTLHCLGYDEQAEAVQILLYTGFRLGELWRIEKRDVDFINKTILVWQTKNGQPRGVPIVDCIISVLSRRIEHCDNAKLFPNGFKEWLENAWNKARELMGLSDDPQFVPHCLRHTCATRLQQQGISLKTTQTWLGHKTIQTTARYAHFNQADLRQAAQCLNTTAIHL